MAKRKEKIEEEQLWQRVQGFVSKLQGEADKRVGQRAQLEEEWILDLQAYHAHYDAKTLKGFDKTGGSRLFVPMTRPKTNAWSAKLMDILFPVDDANWEIEPTPVPSMGHNGGPSLDEESPEAKQAEDACKEMAKEIEDQLVECSYPAQCRDMIDDACKIGTGIIEGPVANDKVRRGWSSYMVKETGEDGRERDVKKWGLEHSSDPRPAYYRIDPWAFFPDDLARTVQESQDNYVRYLWVDQDMRDFAKRDGVNANAVREILRQPPTTQTPSYLTRIRTLTGTSQDSVSKFYQVWKFSGVLRAEDMLDLATAFGDQGTQKEMVEADPLDAVKAVIWFCQGRILKFSIHPLDSGESTYSVFCLEKDEGTLWGYGIARMMRDPQKALNAAWRMLMDNSALAVGDQIIINKNVIEPEDDNWKLTPLKVWQFTEAAGKGDEDVRRAFANFSIDSHASELSAIIELCYRQIDDATAMPNIAQGQDPGALPANTPVGTAVLRQVAANVVFKRIIKNWDDDVTVPNLRRLYDWNMQFSDRDEIKGDYDVKARGASVLLVRELESQNLLAVSMTVAQGPYAKYQKGQPIVAELYRSMNLKPEKFVVSEDEAAEIDRQEAALMAAQAGAGTGPAVDPAIENRKLDMQEREIEAKVAIAEMESDSRMRVAQLNFDATMHKAAEDLNKNDANIASKERTVAVEAALRASEKEPLNETQVANT